MGTFGLLKNFADEVLRLALDPPEAARLREAGRLLKAYRHEAKALGYGRTVKPQDVPTGRLILEADPGVQISVLFSVFSNARPAELTPAGLLCPLVTLLSRRRLPYTEVDLLRLTRMVSSRSELMIKQAAVRALERYGVKSGLSCPLQEAAAKLRASVSDNHRVCHKLVARINALLGGEPAAVIQPGEPWGDAVLADLAPLPVQERAAWNTLLAHALGSEATRPSRKWLIVAEPLVEAVGRESFQDRVLFWFGLFAKSAPTQTELLQAYAEQPPTYEQVEEWRDVVRLVDHNRAVLKGLVWCCHGLVEEAVVSALGDLAQAALKPVPGVGPKSARVGNACVVTLGAMPGMAPVAQLSRLKMRVKHRASLRLIETVLAATAARADQLPEDLEELAVPSFGLDGDGRLREAFGGFVAELSVTGTGRQELAWKDPSGKPIQSVPTPVRRDYAEPLKALKGSVEEINKGLSDQRGRIERLMLSDRSWTLAQWRDRYLNHPLLGCLCRRLIWHFDGEGRTGLGGWRDGRLVDETGSELGWVAEGTRVRMWHPLGFAPETVLAWRRWLEESRFAQPFKQAHREVYLLTDAELTTRTYSNRFAGHIVRQHQLNALCRQRGWQYHLQGRFDGDSVPTLLLPQWGVQVEFRVAPVVQGALSESYIFLYLSTDQVRFSREAGNPLPLTEVPALAFSEAMRDVDLFVGVCSVGNDPHWEDGGEIEQYAGYWRDYAFGDLGASAKTRQDVLSRLLPRLKIAPQCRLDGRFLRVQGRLRAYKIHLGSGNILMEPNDQYLCIVPDRRSEATRGGEGVFLPFEGDQTLSVILSKAFLLADDTSIKDPTIVQQIRH